MNYGAEPADQVVRYSLEGMEYSLKITGNVAKHVAVRTYKIFDRHKFCRIQNRVRFY